MPFDIVHVLLVILLALTTGYVIVTLTAKD